MSGRDSDPRMGFEIGKILEQAREERGLSLHQVEQATKIRARYLKELERENFDVLPAVYVQGSLRTYADYLGLDTEALIRELKYRQAQPRRPVYGEPSSSGVAGSSFPAADFTGSSTRSRPEEKRYLAPVSGAGGNNGLYLGSVALLILVLAVVAFASTLATPSQSQISKMRKPLASQVPDGGGADELASLLRSHSGDSPGAGEEKEGPPPKRESSDTNAEVKGSWRNERAEENQDEPGGAQGSYAVGTVQPSTATAAGTATATVTAIATATATAGASQPTVIPDSQPEPTVPSPPQAEPTAPAAETPAPEPAAGGPGEGSPGRRIVVVVVAR